MYGPHKVYVFGGCLALIIFWEIAKWLLCEFIEGKIVDVFKKLCCCGRCRKRQKKTQVYFTRTGDKAHWYEDCDIFKRRGVSGPVPYDICTTCVSRRKLEVQAMLTWEHEKDL